MGLYDRDYMRKERKPSEEIQHSKLPDFENVKRFLSRFKPSEGSYSSLGQYKPSPTLPFAFWLWLFAMTLAILFWAFLLLVRP
jgi:hypothetical protein